MPSSAPRLARGVAPMRAEPFGQRRVPSDHARGQREASRCVASEAVRTIFARGFSRHPKGRPGRSTRTAQLRPSSPGTSVVSPSASRTRSRFTATNATTASGPRAGPPGGSPTTPAGACAGPAARRPRGAGPPPAPRRTVLDGAAKPASERRRHGMAIPAGGAAAGRPRCHLPSEASPRRRARFGRRRPAPGPGPGLGAWRGG
jgi:hypothetical protein